MPAERAPGFVLAPPVAPSPSRRCAPLPASEIKPRANRVVVCVVPHCGGEVIESKIGKERTPDYAGRCESCRREIRSTKERQAYLRRHGVAA